MPNWKHKIKVIELTIKQEGTRYMFGFGSKKFILKWFLSNNFFYQRKYVLYIIYTVNKAV